MRSTIVTPPTINGLTAKDIFKAYVTSLESEVAFYRRLTYAFVATSIMSLLAVLGVKVGWF